MAMQEYKLKRKNLLDPTPAYIKLADAGLLLLIIAVFVTTIGAMQARDHEDQIMAQKEQTRLTEQQAGRYAAMVAQCFNGGVLWDKLNETAYFCSKPLELKNP